MVKLVVTDKIKDALKAFSEQKPGKSVQSLRLISIGNLTAQQRDCLAYIEHRDLAEIAMILKESHDAYSFCRLIRGSGIYIPPKPAPLPKSEAFIRQMEMLKIKAQEDEYKALLGASSNFFLPSDNDTISPGQEVKIVREQLSTIVNIFVSVASVSWALWFWTGSSGYSDATRTLVCVFGGLGILVAEVVVYLGYQNKVEAARVLEHEKVENKKVISTTLIGTGNSSEKAHADDTLRQRKPATAATTTG